MSSDGPVRGGRLAGKRAVSVLTAEGSRIDGLRAAAAATWEAAGDGQADEDAVKTVLASSFSGRTLLR